jgi:hypothetical protein
MGLAAFLSPAENTRNAAEVDESVCAGNLRG